MHYLVEQLASGEGDNVFLMLFKFQEQYIKAKEIYSNKPLQAQLKVLDVAFLMKTLMHNQYFHQNMCHNCQNLMNEQQSALTS